MAIRDFVSTDVEDALIQAGAELSANYWKIGRLVIQAVEQTELLRAAVIAGKVNLPRQKVDELMALTVAKIYAHAATLTGKSSKRIQEYVTCARFYPDEVVEAYGVLPFDHFDFARQFGERWRDVLDLSIRQIERNYGRPPSVDWLRAQFADDDPQGQTFEQVLADHANAAYFEDTVSMVGNAEPGAATMQALRRLEMAVSGLAGLAGSLPLNENQRSRWRALVDEMAAFLRELTPTR